MAAIKKMDKAKATMVYLDEAVLDTIKRDALASGISMAEWIREAVAERLKRKQRKAVRR
jgi:predicted HicB family RNase H-like nuclease